MVRKGSRGSSAGGATSHSPTQTATATNDRKVSPRRIRGVSPNRPSGSRSSLVRPRRSKRSDSITSPSSETSDNSNRDFKSPQESTMQIIPKHWTSESGKFSPKQSDYGFDARSNMAINVRLGRNTVESNQVSSDESSLSNGSEDTNGNTSNDTHKTNDTNDESPTKKKKKVKGPLLEGEIEDPVKRHQFYKKLKKAGIKKTFEFDDDWETGSVNSEISEISLGNASYILDLAQQKESRKNDREEEALEEALDLYGTWLTEGKNDDKNIFLMILHEVKREQKEKYKKADKRHAALLDAALDDELKRRERVKQEEQKHLQDDEEEEARKNQEGEKNVAALETVAEVESETKTISHSSSSSSRKKTGSNRSRSKRSVSNRSIGRGRSLFRKESDSKISEIITTQRTFSADDHEDRKNEADETDGSPEWHDSLHSSELSHSKNEDEEPDREKSSGRSSTHSRRSIHSRGRKRPTFLMGSKTNVTKTPPESSNLESQRRSSKDTKGLFGRLRRTLSEKEAQQSKEHEMKWRKQSAAIAMTAEEKWWKKINEAKQERGLFDQAKAILDMTLNTTGTDISNTMANSTFSNVPRISEGGNSTANATDGKRISEISNEQKSIEDHGAIRSRHERKGAIDVPHSTELKDESKLPKTKDKKKKKKAKNIDRNEDHVEGIMDLNDVDESLGARPKSGKKKKSKAKSVDKSDTSSVRHGKKKKKKKPQSSLSSASSDDAIQGENDNASVDWTHRCIIQAASQESGRASTVMTMES